MFQLLWTQLNNSECVLVYVFVSVHKMTLLNYEPRKTVGFKELPWFFRIIIMMANDYDNDNGSDIGISFSIQHLDWQLYTITVGLTHKTYWCSTYIYNNGIDFIESWQFGIWMIIFSLVSIFRWVKIKKVADHLIELWDNIRQLSKFWDKLPKSKQPQSKSYKNVQEAINDHFTLAKLNFFSMCLILWNLF